MKLFGRNDRLDDFPARERGLVPLYTYVRKFNHILLKPVSELEFICQKWLFCSVGNPLQK